MKKGMASKAKLSNPVAIRCATVVKVGMAAILGSIVSRPDMPILHAIGTPMPINTIKLKTSINTSIFSYCWFS
jgi:hypothetical protein